MVRTLEVGRRPAEVREAATPWTEDRLAQLRQLWVEEALSSGEIARRMGLSRGTVMGKINRLGLLRHSSEPPPPVLSSGAEEIPEQAQSDTAPEAAAFEVVAEDGSGSSGAHPTIFALRARHCRFPLGDFREPAVFFCGKPAELPKPYCRECCQRAYVVSKPR